MEFFLQHLDCRGDRTCLRFPRRIDFGDLQRSSAILLDRVWVRTAGVSWFERCRRLVRFANAARCGCNIERFCAWCLEPLVEIHGLAVIKPDGYRMVWAGHGIGLRFV